MEYIFREVKHIEYQKRENIILVTHDLFIRVFMLNFLKLDISIIDTIRHPHNCEFWVIEKQPNGHYLVKSDIFDEENLAKLSIKNKPELSKSSNNLPSLSLDSLKSRSCQNLSRLSIDINKEISIDNERVGEENNEEIMYAEDDSED